MASYDKESVIRYVDGELPAAERETFEAAMQGDAELAAEVALYRSAKSVLAERLPADAGREALEERLSGLRERHFKKPVSYRWLSIAAAVACIVVGVELLWPASYARRIDVLGQTEMIGITERGSQGDTLLQAAAVLFNARDFTKALIILDQAVAADSSNQLALFYRGVAAWHTGDLVLARESLERVYERGSLLRNDAAFYMALTYAGEKNGPAARKWLGRIPVADRERLKVNELENLLK